VTDLATDDPRGPVVNDSYEAVLRRHLTYLAADQPLAADAPLKDLGLDSMQAVELVFDLEDELGVALPDEAMTAETFATARSLWSAVTAAREQAAAATW
jgi:acyl carrier protein